MRNTRFFKPLTPFGASVTKVLNENRLSTAALAKELGVNESQIRQIYYGVRPGYECQKKIASFLKKNFGVDIETETEEKRVRR